MSTDFIYLSNHGWPLLIVWYCLFLQFAAHQLHQDAKNWEEKDNDMVSAAKRMARLMMQMAKFARYEHLYLHIKLFP